MPRRKSAPKSGLAAVIKRLRYKKLAKKRRGNPDGDAGGASGFFDEMKATGVELLPTLGAFGGSTLLVRLFDKFVARFEKKLGPLSRHAAVLAWIATLVSVYYVTTKIRAFRSYRTPVLIGTTLAAVVHLLPKYMPALGWIVGQPQTAPALPGVVVTGKNGQQVMVTPVQQQLAPPSNGTAESAEAVGADLPFMGDDESWGGGYEAVREAEDDDLFSGIFS